jgi:hypothetical protein
MPTTMRRNRSFLFLFAFAALALSPLVAAGVKGTGGGVTTSVGNPDPTTPSADVQSQSSGFVQQNQQSANTGAAGTLLTPGGPVQSGAAGQTTGPGAGSSTAAGDASAKGADGKPVAPGTPGAPGAAAAAAPAQPAAPPPDYVSVVRRLNRQPGDKAQQVDVVTDKPARAEAAEPQEAVSDPVPPPKPPPQNQPHPIPNHAVADADKHVAPERAASPPAATGGRGAAPDGYTFYIGLILAGALLAFAASLYLRTGGGGNITSP